MRSVLSALHRTTKTITFDGASGTGLSGAAVPIFTVTGEVIVAYLVPTCTVDLVSAGAGQIALGVTGSTSLFVGATVATVIDAGEFWVDTTSRPNGFAIPAALKDIAITDNIIGTITVGDITGGEVRFDIWWLPLVKNANVQ